MYVWIWLVLSCIGLLTSIRLVIEARRDLFALLFLGELHNLRDPTIVRLAEAHLIQEVVLTVYMTVAVMLGILVLLEIQQVAYALLLILLLVLVLVNSIIRLVERKRTIKEKLNGVNSEYLSSDSVDEHTMDGGTTGKDSA